MVDESYSGFVQRHNMMIGVLFCALLTSIVFSIFPMGFFFMADIYLVIGGGIGLYFTLKNRKESQSHIKTGIIVGLIGSVLSLFLIVFFDWILYSLDHGFDLILFLNYIFYVFVVNGLMYALVGVILGYIFGYFYRNIEA